MPMGEASKLIGRLFEANVVGIFLWNLEGAITGANEAFLPMVKYDREDLASGRVRWTDLTPAEWRERDERAVTELKGQLTKWTFSISGDILRRKTEQLLASRALLVANDQIRL